MTLSPLTTSTTPKYAGFGMRMLASFIDSVLSLVILIPFFELFHKVFGVSEAQQLFVSGAITLENMSQEQLADFILGQSVSLTMQNVVMAACILIFWIYRSATPGKMILRMKIIDATTGLAPTRRQLIIRYLGYFVALLPVGLGFIWIYYDKKHQGWHDKMANTAVIYR